MHPEQYDAWYRSARGRWIGEIEFRMLLGALRLAPGETVLDVGCGTGYFTRRLARETRAAVAGVDPDLDRLRYARTHAAGGEVYLAGRAERLPFAAGSFDCAIAVTSLCFIEAQRAALAEILRVARRRIAIGLLNRMSLLYLQKGRRGGSGGYRGARWHTPDEARALFEGLPARNLTLSSAVALPAGGVLARGLERILPRGCLCGAFLLAAADIAD